MWIMAFPGKEGRGTTVFLKIMAENFPDLIKKKKTFSYISKKVSESQVQ